MPLAILYYLGAGALLIGGPATGLLLLGRGRQEAAAHALAREQTLIARLLRTETDLAQVREQARAAGVDPDLVEQGYRDLRDNHVTLDQILDWLQSFRRT
ncbi:hypothetical protein Q0Z83_042580 [Actinoplanes sichuanensis]|uniref:Uncharacterized protein n=1 Tax=Actinoplanes sichuanensis TaxID=512349 RepID=A0ABW4AUE3_9ACTN|nr:hypothetical protein [Actinoplanes sichuanensis]BEL06067.1 hypothetical protein Q0Z83_042580 [Actinoplanes sichuanensis]